VYDACGADPGEHLLTAFYIPSGLTRALVSLDPGDLWTAYSSDLLTADLLTADLWTADLLTADLLTADLLTADLWTADLLTADLLTADLLTADLLTADLWTAYVCVGWHMCRMSADKSEHLLSAF
jgi:hypothetical protein